MALRHPWRLAVPFMMMAGLYVLSDIPGHAEPPEDDLLGLVFYLTPAQLQNLLHIPVYGVLTMAWIWALTNLRTAVIIAVAISLGYGFFDEWHQSFVPGRYASATDLLLNSIGVVIGAFFYTKLAISGPGSQTS